MCSESGNHGTSHILYSRVHMNIDDLRFSGVCLGSILLPHLGRVQLV